MIKKSLSTIFLDKTIESQQQGASDDCPMILSIVSTNILTELAPVKVF